jgi:hypothetical protein
MNAGCERRRKRGARRRGDDVTDGIEPDGLCPSGAYYGREHGRTQARTHIAEKRGARRRARRTVTDDEPEARLQSADKGDIDL